VFCSDFWFDPMILFNLAFILSLVLFTCANYYSWLANPVFAPDSFAEVFGNIKVVPDFFTSSDYRNFCILQALTFSISNLYPNYKSTVYCYLL